MPRIPKPWKRTTGERAGTWYVQIGGTQYNLGKAKKAAFEKYSVLLGQHNLGELGSKCTMHELIRQYETWLRANRAKTTVAARLTRLARLKAHFDAKKKAEDVKPFQIEEWARASDTPDRILSPTTVHDQIHLAKHVFARGKKLGLIGRNPIADMEAPTPKMRRFFLPPERFDALFAALENDVEGRDFVRFMLETGARAAEMHVLRVEWLDEKNHRIVFPIEKSKGEHRAGALQRVIHLNATAYEIAARRLRERPNGGPMFVTTAGKPIDNRWSRKLFVRLKAALDEPEMCATVLRHSYAYARLQQGQNPVIVAKLMGHRDTKMLYTRYGHLESGDLLSEKANEIELTRPTP